MSQQYDAELLNPQKHTFPNGKSVYTGQIYNDRHTHGLHPFRDGNSVRTSFVEAEFEVNGEKFIETMNTTYKVIKDAPTVSKQPRSAIETISLSR